MAKRGKRKRGRPKHSGRLLTDVPEPQEFGPKRIRQLRERLGKKNPKFGKELSQADFANLLGASRDTIRAWEQGTKAPSAVVRRFLEILESVRHVGRALSTGSWKKRLKRAKKQGGSK